MDPALFCPLVGTTETSSFPPSCSKRVSKSIPIAHDSKNPTPSELELLQAEAMAEHRDYCMYCRIINGIRQRRSMKQLMSRSDNETISNIIQTRRQTVFNEPSASYTKESLKLHSTMRSPQQTPEQKGSIHINDGLFLQTNNNFRKAIIPESSGLGNHQQDLLSPSALHVEDIALRREPDSDECFFEMDD